MLLLDNDFFGFFRSKAR